MGGELAFGTVLKFFAQLRLFCQQASRAVQASAVVEVQAVALCCPMAGVRVIRWLGPRETRGHQTTPSGWGVQVNSWLISSGFVLVGGTSKRLRPHPVW